MKEILIKTENLMKTFITGDTTQNIINNLSLEIYKHDFTIIMGSSGSGKSTLLYSLSSIDSPSSGSIYYGDLDITKLNNDELAKFRAEKCGFVFQQHSLIDTMSIMDNVLIAGLVKNKSKKELIKKANELFDIVEVLPHTRTKLPTQISGGRAQRVGIVRALINNPEVLFADEPTGSLNSKTTDEVLDLFTKFNNQGQSIVMVTHDIKCALRGNRILYAKDGTIVGELNLPPYKENDEERRNKVNEFLKKLDW